MAAVGGPSGGRRRTRGRGVRRRSPEASATLPDYLTPGMRLLFVGINPSTFSVQRGHYYARPTNRFWRAFSRSLLSAPLRRALGREELGPEDDRALLEFGMGFTDVAKVPSRQASHLPRRAFAAWAPLLRDRIMSYQPAVVCFQGLTAWRGFARYALGKTAGPWSLGLQRIRVGRSRLFVVPSPSAANARVTLGELVSWYNRLARLLPPGAGSRGARER